MDRKLRFLWWGILGILLVMGFIKFLLPVRTPLPVEPTQANREIVVYITGAVLHPGLLSLPLDARLDDALEKAVLSGDADLEVLNPAQKLKDGQKIIVPYKASMNLNNELQGDSEAAYTPSSGDGSGRMQSGSASKVNINYAGITELDSIPGIGPALAQRIIDYRTQNGPFSSPEEIQNVSGIGPKTYEKMAAYVTVGP